MATVVATSMTGSGQRLVTEVTLGASNVLPFNPSKAPVLILRNATGGSLSPIIDGADGTTVEVEGMGAVSVSSGYAVGAIAAGAVRAIPLNSISKYCQGVVDITGGTGLVAVLLEY